MKLARRCWQPRPAFAPRVAGLWRSPAGHTVSSGRFGLSSSAAPVVLRAVRTSESSSSGTPLSLSDILVFESDMPAMLIQEQPPERKAEEIVDRAARVLQEVNSLLSTEQGAGGGAGRGGRGGAATATAAPPGAAESSTAFGSELSRAIFGGSAQVSEAEAERTRQALQRTLESSTPPPPSSTSTSTSTSTTGGDGGGGAAPAAAAAAAKQRPAWAQELFASGGASTGPSTSSTAPTSAPSAASTSSSSGPTSSASSASSSSGKPSSGPSAPAAPSRGGGGMRSTASSVKAPAQPASTSAPTASAPSASASSSSAPYGGGGGGGGGARVAEPPPPQMQRASRLAEWTPLAFADADLSLPTELTLKSEDALLTDRARSAVLPPLQSVVDLTAAVRPPSRGLDLGGGGAEAAAAVSEAVAEGVAVDEEQVTGRGALGRQLADGAGRLADGTRFEKLSGTDKGADGYVKKWEVLRGVTGDGTVQWEECWWTASNRYGLREMGAFKKGSTETGAAWVEEWKEVLYTHSTNLRLVIERTAHKWARDENADEWEEKWGECYEEAGRVHKFADKWAKAGANVWHERWGEDYDGRGACQKWTDKWAERLLPGGGQEQWGDKWTETFGAGKGTKHGEVWSAGGGGERYNRWWNEEHYGDGRVRKWGNSNTGEYWDTVEHMDTYYNPVPHFGFRHAVGHSPNLWAVPLPPPEEGAGSGSDDDGLGEGLGRL
ncbi:hypothetical protein HYH02_008969 [Chlamydomonas schloesseri]|uniref:Uncharacterized protein n=1 Tax=Chlamydomonas schloesseri TaxID=2026947 RepID=A0A836B1Y4_9CHLO|nr:hypothetical protein HYH02_008969 [Chlamydomonas schloesseri]|eukprot:KAG2445102.1 hypothetical protein HYH02_008969 [Chlamydomonas schloesseri]